MYNLKEELKYFSSVIEHEEDMSSNGVRAEAFTGDGITDMMDVLGMLKTGRLPEPLKPVKGDQLSLEEVK